MPGTHMGDGPFPPAPAKRRRGRRNPLINKMVDEVAALTLSDSREAVQAAIDTVVKQQCSASAGMMFAFDNYVSQEHPDGPPANYRTRLGPEFNFWQQRTADVLSAALWERFRVPPRELQRKLRRRMRELERERVAKAEAEAASKTGIGAEQASVGQGADVGRDPLARLAASRTRAALSLAAAGTQPDQTPSAVADPLYMG